MEREINKVRNEIDEFSQRLLPHLALRDSVIFQDFLDKDCDDWRRRLRTLDDWQAAASHLRQLLIDSLSERPRTSVIENFSRFMMGGTADEKYVVKNGAIRWQLSVYAPMTWEEVVKLHKLHLPESLHPQQNQGRAPSVVATRGWLEQASAGDIDFMNALCTVLPFIADDDPAFAMTMLQPQAYRDRIRSRDGLTPSQRQTELEKVDAFYFGYVLNNSLLHVVAALANNHFLDIRQFLQIPNYSGRYTDLIPHYLFAILIAKVSVLTRDGGSSGACVNRCSA